MIFAVLCALSAAITSVTGAGSASDRLNHDGTDPFNATYRIEGRALSLMDGRSESPAAPGSAMKIRTAVMGQPLNGDMDGDGDEDPVLLLTHDPGGSGTFVYLAVAINEIMAAYRQALPNEKTYRPVFMVLAGKRALAYEFCIPDTVRNRTEVERIDPTVEFFAESPGRIGCGKDESLCIGTTHQQEFARILGRLAELTYVQRIDQSFFE